MKTKSILTQILTIILLITISKTLFSQIPNFSNAPAIVEGDSLNITYLINNGVKISNNKLICWFPKDSLSEKKMNEIKNMITIGIKGAEKFINAPLSWQFHTQKEPYTIYFRFDNFVSHASKAGFVSIPFWRIKEGKAPWLHEILHEMLFSKYENTYNGNLTEKELYEKIPWWIYEGLPEYIALQVSIMKKLHKFDPLSKGYQTNVDSLFLKEFGGEKSEYILSFIGRKGIMPELFSSKDRHLYAPTFYYGSCSFIKYITDNFGIEVMLSGISAFGQEQDVIEKLTCRPLEALKEEWLNKIKNHR